MDQAQFEWWLRWIPLFTALSAIGGGLVTAIATIGTMLIQQRSEARRHLMGLALEAATAEHKFLHELAQENVKGTNEVIMMPPLSASLHYNVRVLQLLADGKLSTETLRELNRERDAIGAMLLEEFKRDQTAAAAARKEAQDKHRQESKDPTTPRLG